MGRAYEVRKAAIQKNGAQKAKLYSNFAKEIYIAAKNGGTSLEANEKLKQLVEKAKRSEVPSDIINRAIDKVNSGADESYTSQRYEGFGPGASTLIIKCLTDNVNRTVGLVRAAFNKVKKSLGVTNSVSYNYDYLGVLSFKEEKGEELFEALLTEGIEIIDYEVEEGYINITMNPSDYNKVKDIIENIISNVDYEVDQIGMFPKEKTTLEGEDKEVFEKLYNMLDDIDDVTEIYHNVNIDL